MTQLLKFNPYSKHPPMTSLDAHTSPICHDSNGCSPTDLCANVPEELETKVGCLFWRKAREVLERVGQVSRAVEDFSIELKRIVEECVARGRGVGEQVCSAADAERWQYEESLRTETDEVLVDLQFNILKSAL